MPFTLENHRRANLGWLFYKHYYESLVAMDLKHDENNRGKDTLANRNETILKRTFAPCTDIFSLKTQDGFPLKINYPGLLMGSGYTHEAAFVNKDDKNEAFKIGFFFDHVTGMPCIPGHSVKGALRAAFPNHKDEKYKKEKSSMIVDMLKKSKVDPEARFELYLEKRKISGASYSDLLFSELLGEIIFEGQEPYQFKNGAFLYEQISLYRKDIFYDAYISKGGKSLYYLAIDYITPHSDPLKDPNPVKFLKILPEVEIHFQFDLKDTLINEKEKEMLFKKILLDFGIGAKTNVGYGQFEEGFRQDSSSTPISNESFIKKTEPENYVGRVNAGITVVEAKVIDHENKRIKMIINGIDCLCEMAVRNCPPKDSLVLVRINTINKKNEILMVAFMKEIQ